MSDPFDSVKMEITRGLRQPTKSGLILGTPAASRVICHNCGYARPLAEAVRYGKYRLCSECASRYELAKRRGAVRSIGEFVLD